MPRRVLLGALAAIVVLAAAWILWPDEKARIRGRLDDLVEEVNSSTTDGFGTVARAAKIGAFFSDDIVIDLGPGTAPIRGRETLMGMAARLQPRTAAFRLAFDDMLVDVLEGDQAAEVSLTATFTRDSAGGESSMDAREFTMGLRKAGGKWVIGRLTAVDTLK